MAASVGYLKALFGTLPSDIRKVFDQMAEHLLNNFQFGPVEHQRRATNFQSYYVNSTTPTSTGEFSIQHGLGKVPYLAIPVLDLSAVHSKWPLLEVSRAPDESRLYFKAAAGSTNVVFSLLVE